MDKYEYKVRANEIEELIRQGAYAEAAEIADTIDWRRVKSVMMLCKVSDLYKMNRRYEDARDMLLLAYERRPGGRSICYSLCELSIKMEEYVQAIEYYKEYVQAVSSPMDTGRYVLQYKLYEAQDVSLEERIAVLEKLKQCDYLPKWGYELAYLYHRVGLASRCVEECDELIAWFGDGKYVMKAMELKMLHQPLSPEQQKKYDHRFDDLNVEEQLPSQEASVEEVSAEETEGGQNEENLSLGDTQVYTGVGEEESPKQEDEMDIHVKTMDVGQYNTINLQAELAEGLREVLAEERPKVTIENPITRSIMAPMLESNTEALDYPDAEDVGAESSQAPVEEMESSEVFFGETGDISSIQKTVVPDVTAEIVMEQLRQENTAQEEVQEEPAEQEEQGAQEEQEENEVQEEQVKQEQREAVPVMGTREVVYPQAAAVMHAEPPKALANVLSQESDGQISLVMPERESIEKQITGQISLEDILAEWERMKKENQEKREEEVRQHVLQQTGTMFTEFEASVRDGLLEQLERGKNVEGLEEAVEDESSDAEEEVIEEEPIAAEEEVIEEETVATEDEVIEEEPVVATEEVIEEEPVAIENEVIEEEPVATENEVIEEESVVSQEIEEAAETLDDVIEDNDEVEELEEIQEQTAEDAEALQEEISGEEAPADSEEEESIAAEEEEASEEEEPEQEEISEEEVPEQEEFPEEEPEEEAAPVVERDKEKVRSLTREEKELFGPYIQSRAAREQLVKAIDNISLAAFTGNVIVTGEEGMDTLSLAKNMIREVQATDSNFSGKVAKISGAALNKKDVAATLTQLKNGALIISKASDMNDETAKSLHKALQQESVGIVVVLEGSRKAIDRFLKKHEELRECFNARMDVEALSNDMLVAFGKQYARELEYSIDDLGMLALHTRIEDMQTIDHAVTVVEVKELVDEAIRHANKKTLGHFFDILFAKRYDEEDMIILSEKDFV